MMPVHSIVQGQGPPLILLHGIGSNSKSWNRQIEEFSKTFTVVAWDAPGFGKSDMPEAGITTIEQYSDALASLMDALHLPSAAILGHSFGGIVAQDFYRRHPRRIHALILADTTHGGGDPSKRLQMIRTLTPEELARQRAPMLLSKNAAPELVEEAIAIMSEVRRPGYEAAAIAMSQADTHGILDDIPIPLLIVWGADDNITPPWPRWPAAAQVEVIPKAGHLCYIEQPEIFNRIVGEFVTTAWSKKSL